MTPAPGVLVAGPTPAAEIRAAPTIPEPAPDGPPGGGFTARYAAIVYLGFAAGVVAVTWPLALHPATLWPPHHDARVFTWVMASMARRLLDAPFRLFQGNAFYPVGESMAFTEILLPPSLLGLPGFVWGDPVLTYNLLLLVLWPLNGLAAAWAAHALTGSRPAAWLAGAVFCLSPYFTEYYLEFQMLLAAILPVVILAWVRWLETADRRWLALTLGGLAVQALTTWYYAVIVGLAFVALAAAVLGLRWGGWQWRRRLAQLLPGLVGLAAVLLPFAWPYLTVHRELGFERDIGETAAHYGDLASFIEPGWRSRLYHFVLTGHVPETSAFVGFVVIALAAGGLVWLRRDPPLPGRALGVARAAVAGLLLSGPALAWVAVLQPAKHRFGPLSIHVRPGHVLDLLVLLGLGLIVLRGFAAHRAGAARPLSRGDWVRLLLWLTGVFVVLSLGPVVHVAGRDLGPGPYLTFYHVLFPLHVVRVTVRFAVIAILGLALLAALGLRALEDRLRARPGLRRLALAAVFGAVALEYAVAPATFEPVTAAPRPVDGVLRADAADGAVLEFPVFFGDSDADAMFRSLAHGKYVVNGLSGFTPASLRDLSGLLTAPGPPLADPGAQAALRRIYPLRSLVVRLADPIFPPQLRPTWIGLRRSPPALLRFRGTFGTEDLYDVVALPERGRRIERDVSYDFLDQHPVLRLAARPVIRGASRDQWVDLLVNDVLLRRIPLNAAAAVAERLGGPRRYAAPNVIALQYGYDRPPTARDARYRIGTTGGSSPADLRVRSGGQPYGDVASIEVNGRERAPGHRGYNLVALDARGRIQGVGQFDTFHKPEAAARLAAFVADVPAGTVVAGAAKDEASGQLTEDAVAALRSLGVAGDLRGHFRESHAFVGLKGARPGTAVEALGPRAVEIVVGIHDEESGLELDGFLLEPDRPGRDRRR